MSDATKTAPPSSSSDAAAMLDAAAHNALHATHRAAAATSDYYGRQLMMKQQEVFALRDRVATLEADNAKLFGWEERAKQLDAAYNDLLTRCSKMITDAAFATATTSPLVVPVNGDASGGMSAPAAEAPPEPPKARKRRKR